MKNNWFEDWFNSPYYHLLYKNRNDDEAKLFMDNLLNFIKPIPNWHLVDLCCGKGRHSMYLNEQGFDVTGLDLSENSIKEASRSSSDSLSFYVHDMRKEKPGLKAQMVLNLFTSFGYFDTIEEHEEVFQSVYKMLNYKGVFILDYLNSDFVTKDFPLNEQKEEGGVTFNINKQVSEGFIEKNIQFEDLGKSYSFQERVRAFTQKDFIKMFESNGFKLIRSFGDYELTPFKKDESPRLIMVAQKVD